MRVLGFLLLTLSLAEPAAAQGMLDPGHDWSTLTMPKRDASVFRFIADDQLEVEADNAVGFLYRELERPPAVTHPALAWRWRIDRDVPARDQFAFGQDDRPIAIHLWFDRPGAGSSLLGGVAEFLGYPRVTHALTYVWGGTHAPGTIAVNPYFAQGQVVVVRAAGAPVATWVEERRDLAADLERAFGDAGMLGDLRFIAISADTDDKGGRSLARLAGLRLERIENAE